MKAAALLFVCQIVYNKILEAMKRILIVEDEPIIRENIAELLEIAGYETRQAENGYIGVQKIIDYKPDIVICDIMMPGLNGFEVLETVRKAHETAAIPFIFLTARATAEDIRKGMSLGADDYLTKPFTKDELFGSVKARLEKSEIHKNLINKKLNEFKTQIGNIYSHELNTPLNGVLGISGLLMHFFDDFSPAEIKEMISTMHAAGKRMEHVVNNMLFYFQIIQFPDFLNHREGDFSESIAYRHNLRNIALDHNREKDLHIDIDELLIPLSKNLFDKVLYELTDNAFKFSKKNSPVRVSIFEEKTHICVRVQDDGRGFDSQITNAGERPFIQIDRQQNEQQGLGLGLFIVRKIMETNNIPLTLKSAIGQGCLVEMQLEKMIE